MSGTEIFIHFTAFWHHICSCQKISIAAQFIPIYRDGERGKGTKGAHITLGGGPKCYMRPFGSVLTLYQKIRASHRGRSYITRIMILGLWTNPAPISEMICAIKCIKALAFSRFLVS